MITVSKPYLTFSTLAFCLLLLAGDGGVVASGKVALQCSNLGPPAKNEVVIAERPQAPNPAVQRSNTEEVIETDLATLQQELHFEIWQPWSLLEEFKLVGVYKFVFSIREPDVELRYVSKTPGSDASFTVRQSKPTVITRVRINPKVVIREVEVNGNYAVLYDIYYQLPKPRPLPEFEPYLAILVWADDAMLFEVWGKDYDLMIKVARALAP